jgi:hypothetical protein
MELSIGCWHVIVSLNKYKAWYCFHCQLSCSLL